MSTFGHQWIISKQLADDPGVDVEAHLTSQLLRQIERQGYTPTGTVALQWIDNDDPSQVICVEYEPGTYDPPAHTWTVRGYVDVSVSL